MAVVRSPDFLRALIRETALATLIHQRRLTPSCGGHAPTAERTVGPARMIAESLTPKPGIREQYLPIAPLATNSLNHLAGKRKQLAHTASFAAFTGRALIIFRAGLALNTVGSFVNGLMPARSFVAGFLMTTNFAKPGNKNAPFFFNSL